MSEVLHIESIQLFEEEQYRLGSYLLVINADKTPPHLALLVSGTFFSLSVDAVKQEDIKVFKTYLAVKKSLVLALKLDDMDKKAVSFE